MKVRQRLDKTNVDRRRGGVRDHRTQCRSKALRRRKRLPLQVRHGEILKFSRIDGRSFFGVTPDEVDEHLSAFVDLPGGILKLGLETQRLCVILGCSLEGLKGRL